MHLSNSIDVSTEGRVRSAECGVRNWGISGGKRAFTMIEIMIVVAIMLIVLTMGAPAIYHIWHPESFQKGVKDVVEACSHARARAILNDVVAELRIHPEDGRMEVITLPPDEAATEGAVAAFSTDPNRPLEPPKPPAEIKPFSARLSDRIRIEMLAVNFVEYKDAGEARVHFYPNGTCDDFTLILRSDQGEWRKISLEVATGLASVDLVEP